YVAAVPVGVGAIPQGPHACWVIGSRFRLVAPWMPPHRPVPHRVPPPTGRSRLRVKARPHDAAAQPLVPVEELIPPPVVDRRGQGRLEVRVTAALEGGDAAGDR